MSPSTKPPVERTISLRAIGDSMRALVAAEERQDVPAMPGRESEKPFPFVKLHVVVPDKTVVRSSSPNISSATGTVLINIPSSSPCGRFLSYRVLGATALPWRQAPRHREGPGGEALLSRHPSASSCGGGPNGTTRGQPRTEARFSRSATSCCRRARSAAHLRVGSERGAHQSTQGRGEAIVASCRHPATGTRRFTLFIYHCSLPIR